MTLYKVLQQFGAVYPSVTFHMVKFYSKKGKLCMLGLTNLIVLSLQQMTGKQVIYQGLGLKLVMGLGSFSKQHFFFFLIYCGKKILFILSFLITSKSFQCVS